MKRTSGFYLVLTALGLFALLLGGCGTTTNDGSRTHILGALDSRSNKLASGEYIDYYICTARSTGVAYVEMDSTDFDSYLAIFPGNSTTPFTENDDATTTTRNALVAFHVTQGQEYVIGATSHAAGETGSYELILSPELGHVDLVTPAQSARLGAIRNWSKTTQPKTAR